MKKFLFISFVFLFISHTSFSQGCVAVRGTGVCMLSSDHSGTNDKVDRWQFNFVNRYYHSYKHFVGTEEQKERVEKGTQVINHTYTGELSLGYNINKYWSVGFMAPIISNSRSSLYEHVNTRRATTHSFGVGDVRLAAYRLLLNPSTHKNFNVQLGLGIKLPTGDYKYQDYFFTDSAGNRRMGPVDQSIQLGDGGTGFTTEVNAYYNFNKVVSAYGNFFYLLSPREQNGVSATRGATPTAAQLKYGNDIMSVPDQYMYRAGINATLHNFTLSAGVRKECIPAKDLVGGSNGFRRPGYIISAEPGLTYRVKKTTLFAIVPIAVERNRTQSVPDKIRSEITKVYYQGDAAFADYSINIGCSVRF